MRQGVTIRHAERSDVPVILHFIRELAAYENMLDEVVADEALLEEWIFDKQKAEVLLAVVDGREVGFALFFHNFSTFLERAGIYLEDLFVLPEYRGCGCGRRCSRSLPPSPSSVDVVAWSGHVWIGTSHPSASTCHLVPSRWTSGRSIGSPAMRSTSSRNAEVVNWAGSKAEGSQSWKTRFSRA